MHRKSIADALFLGVAELLVGFLELFCSRATDVQGIPTDVQFINRAIRNAAFSIGNAT